MGHYSPKDDNPYSESQFKTMKYRPDYPKQFEGMQGALRWARDFFHWYNQEHYHSGLGLMTPEAVHYGLAEKVYEQRSQVLAAAYEAHPERFVSGEPTPSRWPNEVWINPSQKGHQVADSLGPAASDMQPSTQAGSEVKIGVPLKVSEHLSIVEQPLDQAELSTFFFPKFEPELSQNC